MYILYNTYNGSSECRSGAERFSEIVNKAAFGGKRTVISRNGKEVAAVIPIADLHLLERLIEAEADRLDFQAARAAINEPGENVSLKISRKNSGSSPRSHSIWL